MKRLAPMTQPLNPRFLMLLIKYYIIRDNHSVQAAVSKPKAMHKPTLRYLRMNGAMNYVTLKNENMEQQ